MLCPHCGAETPAPGGRCTACQRAVHSGGAMSVATGALTSAIDAQSETSLATSPTPPPRRATQGPLEAGAPFGSRYRILRSLGAGGMGVVYQAWDDELGVAVALKVIRPEVTADPHVAREVERRFKRELLLARQVTHKNVVRIHDLGEVDGIKYITMPYVEGRDLADVLRESGALPVPRVLRMARQVAAGLQAAHEAGVIHRDLKPENIMIDADDQALIMDFGISRTTRNTSATMTQHGAIVGTLEYMAPEQGRGATIDHRADIYAFGLMLHDMLAGRRRLDAAEGAVAEMMSRMQKAPPPLRTLVPAVPEPLERIVSKCVQPDADQRYATTAELVADLERLDDSGHVVVVQAPRVGTRSLIAAAALVLVSIAVTWWWVARRPASPPAPVPQLSVLITNFRNETGESVLDGSLEQPLAIGIEGAPFIHTFPRRDALRLVEQLKPGSALDEEMGRLVSRREGIRILLAGSVKRSGSGYELTVRAIDPATDEQKTVVSQRASDKAGILDAVGKVAGRVREALGDTAAEASEDYQKETFTARSLEAVKSYSTAQDLAARGRYEESIVHYRRAVEQDPDLGRAYSGWATSAFFLGRSDEATQILQKALRLLDRMTEREKYRTQGTYYFVATQNYRKAIENYTELVERYPADFAGHNNLAVAHFSVLNFAKALEHGRKALEIYPSNVIIRTNYALYAMYAGDFTAAAAEAPKLLEIDKTFHKAYLVQAMAAMAERNADGARNAYERMAGASDATGALVASLGLADVAMYYGRWDEAERLLSGSLGKDREAKNSASLGAKLIALSEVYSRRNRPGDQAQAVRAALEALATEGNEVPAGIALARLGRTSEALAVAKKLQGTVQEHSRAYAAIIQGELALRRKAPNDAIDAFRNGREHADFWLGRLGSAIAYVEKGMYVEALAEIETCEKRRGEATAVFLDDLPTFRYTSQLPYWRGRAQAGLGQSAAADSFRAFLALRQGEAAADPLAVDARTRLAR